MDPGNPNVRSPESSKPQSHRRRRRRRQRPPPAAPASDVDDPFTAGASRPLERDVGADSIAAPGHPPTQQGYLFQSIDGRCLGPVILDEFLRTEAQARRSEARAWRSRAFSSAAPPSDHPGVGRRGSARRVRQSVLYSVPRQTQHTEQRDSEEEDLSVEQRMGRLRSLGVSSASYSAGIPSDPLGAIKSATRTRIRQSLLYSNRPRRMRHKKVTEPTQEHPTEVSSGELGKATDLRTLEGPSLRDAPLLTPQTAEESDYEDGAYSYNDHEFEEDPSEVRRSEEFLSWLYSLPEDTSVDWWGSGEARRKPYDLSSTETWPESDTEAPHVESDYGYDKRPRVNAYGQTILYFNRPKGISRSMVLDAGSLCTTVSDDEEQLKLDSDFDSDVFQSEDEESERPGLTIREILDKVAAKEHAYRTAQAAEWGTKPPSAVIAQASAEAQKKQETLSLPAPQQDSAAAMQRHEASTEDIVQKGKKWMCDEVMLCFKKYMERRPDFMALEYKLDELCHQCFNVDSSNKVFHHYNFKVMMKMPSSVNWTVELYFAEVKQIFGRKFYFCCALEEDEDGACYACKKQGVEDLKHPVTGGFMGSPDAHCSLW